MKAILFVDDEIQIIKALERVFFDAHFKIYTVNSGEAALELLSRSAIDMVVTDIRMPGMDGVELLKRIKLMYPDTIRLILSGYTDENEIISILQNNLAKTYLFKPWDNDELIRVINQNIEPYKQLPHEVITYINNLDKLPTINSSYRKIINTIDEGKNAANIAAEIEKDHTVSAKVLQIVNSAYYGIKTGSVQKALTFIGINVLKSLVSSLEIMEYLSGTGKNCYISEEIWKHVYNTNKILNFMQENYGSRASLREAGTAGLLHKVGIVFMLKYDPQCYKELYEYSCSKKIYLKQLEINRYGYSHTDISAYLLKWWNAPDTIIKAAEYYDNPLAEEAVYKELLCSVHIAQHYASKMNDEKPYCDLVAEAFDVLQISKEAFEENRASKMKV